MLKIFDPLRDITLLSIIFRMFLAFLCGMLSADFDLSMISVDACKKLVKTPLDDPEMESFFEKLDRISESHHCSFVLSLSESSDQVPEYIRKYAV